MQSLSSRHSQQGAALVVGLVLLLVLTLLAVSGMNTASTELIMARNEQSQENVFQGAESGIEQAITNGSFHEGADDVSYPTIPTQVPSGPAGVTYQTTISPRPAKNVKGGPMWNSSSDLFTTYHFEIRSRAEARAQGMALSTRPMAVGEQIQGLFLVAPNMPDTPPPLAGVTGLTAPP